MNWHQPCYLWHISPSWWGFCNRIIPWGGLFFYQSLHSEKCSFSVCFPSFRQIHLPWSENWNFENSKFTLPTNRNILTQYLVMKMTNSDTFFSRDPFVCKTYPGKDVFLLFDALQFWCIFWQKRNERNHFLTQQPHWDRSLKFHVQISLYRLWENYKILKRCEYD